MNESNLEIEANIHCPMIIMNPVVINLQMMINNNLPTIEITPSVDEQINQMDGLPSSQTQIVSTITNPNSKQSSSTMKPIGWQNKLGLAAVCLILIMFTLDVLTLWYLLKKISSYERSVNLLERIKFLIDYSGTLSDKDCERLSLMPQYDEIMLRIRQNVTTTDQLSMNNIDKQSLINELSMVSEQKSNLLTVIVVTFVAMIIHFIGFIGVLRQSFTLTLFETLFLIILLIMKPSLSSTNFGWIIWILYAVCLPLFFIYQIRLYYVKIRRKK
ncbi:hypothetical protein DERF_012086 [Dermatophagoides farinae]|uniref:Transmembrane protein n=2 Tax=Dermatophagoides farinae TaxID=6954 RepID=A0A922HNY2_DERFA|nr:hypothetical protein DERF_012086 [Dermatophagoides farinae]